MAIVKTAAVYVRDVPTAFIVPPIFSLFCRFLGVLDIRFFFICMRSTIESKRVRLFLSHKFSIQKQRQDISGFL